MLSYEIEAVTNLVPPKLAWRNPAALRRKMTESRICDNRQSSHAADRVTKIEVLKIAIAFKKDIEKILVEHFATKEDRS